MSDKMSDKKFIAIILAIAICLTNICLGSTPYTADISVSAETYSNLMIYGDYLYYKQVDKDRDGTYDYIIITDCDTYVKTVDIPSEIDGLPVTSIGERAFYECSGLTSITIPNSVTTIGSSTFELCTSLTNIKLPDSITSIGGFAFSDCSSLTSITIPDSVTSIGAKAFSDCGSLTSIEIPNGVTSIVNSTFEFCKNLTSITIPNSITSIGNNAFYYCTSLTSIEIPDSVTSIEQSAFYHCDSLTSIEIPNSVTSIEQNAFSDCTSLTSITIKNPECKIYGSAINNGRYDNSIVYYNGVISGYENSTAQAYAQKYDYTFESIGKNPTVTTEPPTTTTSTIICTTEITTTTTTPVSIVPITSATTTRTTTSLPVYSIYTYLPFSSTTTSTTTTPISIVPITSATTTRTTTSLPVYSTYTYVTMIMPTTTTTTTTSYLIKGDVNYDGVVDLLDVVEIAKSLLPNNRDYLTGEQIYIADINESGKADLYDAIYIAKDILNEIPDDYIDIPYNENISDGEIGIEAGDISGRAGTSVSVPLYIRGTDECVGAELIVDSPSLEIDSLSGCMACKVNGNKATGVFASGDHFSDDIGSVKIDIPYDTEPGEYPINIKVYKMVLDGGEIVSDAIGVSGILTVEKSAQIVDWPGGVGIELGKAGSVAGAEVNIPIYLRGTSECISCELEVSADSPLEIIEGSGSFAHEITDNNAFMLFLNSSGYYANSEIGSIKIRISGDAAPGIYPVNIKINNMAYDDGTEQESGFTYVNGSVSVLDKKLTLSETKLNLSVGETAALEVLNYEATIKWLSDDSSIATVRNGLVKAVSDGTTTIYAIAGNDILKCKVTVSGNTAVTTAVTTDYVTPETSTTIVTTSITTCTTEISTTTPISTVPVTSASPVTLTSATKATSVTSYATMTEISATSTTGVTKTTLNTTSVKPITSVSTETDKPVTTQSSTTAAPYNISLSETEVDLEVGDSVKLIVEYFDGEVKWFSDDTSIATVKDGRITAVSAGTVEIYAMTDAGNLTCIVNVIGSAVIDGDIDGNGKADLYDAIIVCKCMIGAKDVTEKQKKNADVNGDGKIDLYDAIRVAELMLKNSKKS